MTIIKRNAPIKDTGAGRRAVTKIMGLDDSGYARHPNYPYDMVHK